MPERDLTRELAQALLDIYNASYVSDGALFNAVRRLEMGEGKGVNAPFPRGQIEELAAKPVTLRDAIPVGVSNAAFARDIADILSIDRRSAGQKLAALARKDKTVYFFDDPEARQRRWWRAA